MLLVFSYLPQGMQVILLSATIPKDSFRNMTKKIMSSNPIKILVKTGQLTLEGIQQFFILMEQPGWKLDTLCDLYTTPTFTHPTVIFCNSRKKVDTLVTKLEERELPASSTVRNMHHVLKLSDQNSCSLFSLILQNSMAKNHRRIVKNTSRTLGWACRRC